MPANHHSDHTHLALISSNGHPIAVQVTTPT